jgi:TrmH family RNA methyltransferase
LLSRNHPTLHRLRGLRRDALLREAEGVFIAEGLHLAAEALACGARVELALTSPRLLASPQGRQLAERLRRTQVAWEMTEDHLLDALQDARSPQPVLLVVRRYQLGLETLFDDPVGVPLLVVVDGVQDPGNLGAIWRTADAAGATGLVACGAGADLYHPRVVRATAGAIFRLAAVAAESRSVLEHLRRRGWVAWGTTTRADRTHDDVDWSGPCAIVLGGEGSGLTGELASALDGYVRIPMRPGAESLSVGAAAAVLLFEAARQRRAHQPPESSGLP